jgi:hypothetical protein
VAGGCHAHPLKPAGFRCEGCARLLCDACVVEGHRLLLCPVCGERAVALAAAGPATVKERDDARRVRAAAAYGWTDLLRYCLRGDGAWTFWVAVALFLLLRFFAAAAAVAPPAQMLLPAALAFLLLVVLVWTVPALLARIVRATLDGRNEVPDWGPAHDYGERQRDLLALLLAALVAVAPSLAVLRILGCVPAARLAPECWAAVAATLPVGIPLGCLGFGAFAAFERLTLVPRIDLHVRVILALGARAWTTAGGIAAGVIGALVAGRLLAFVPVAGAVAQTVLLVWTLLTGAHAVGVLLRRAPQRVEALYG